MPRADLRSRFSLPVFSLLSSSRCIMSSILLVLMPGVSRDSITSSTSSASLPVTPYLSRVPRILSGSYSCFSPFHLVTFKASTARREAFGSPPQRSW